MQQFSFCCVLARKQERQEGHEETLGVLVMTITLIVVRVSRVFVYAQTHQIIHIKCLQFFVSLYSNKTD